MWYILPSADGGAVISEWIIILCRLMWHSEYIPHDLVHGGFVMLPTILLLTDSHLFPNEALAASGVSSKVGANNCLYTEVVRIR